MTPGAEDVLLRLRQPMLLREPDQLLQGQLSLPGWHSELPLLHGVLPEPRQGALQVLLLLVGAVSWWLRGCRP